MLCIRHSIKEYIQYEYYSHTNDKKAHRVLADITISNALLIFL